MVEIRQPGKTTLFVSLREPTEIGRECGGLHLADDRMSRRHARLSPAGPAAVTVEDLGSSNGTTVDGVRVSAPVKVESGQTVRCGDTTIMIEPPPVTPQRPTGTVTGEGRATSIEQVADRVSSEGIDLSRVTTDHGTVTIVFSDIESSTERNVELGDAVWFDVLGNHNRIVETQVQRWGGTIIKNQGDGFMLSFAGARRALDCMAEVQRQLTSYSAQNPDRRIRVRMGLHTGEVIAGDDGDIFGQHVVVAARVANLADGGEILVSSLTREIVRARGDIDLDDAREVELKGIGPATVYRFDWAKV